MTTKAKRRSYWTPEQGREFGLRLVKLREEAGMSQRELAFDGCTAAYISRVEKGERYPSVVIIRVLAVRLGVAAEYLEFGTEGGVAVCAKADADAINSASRRFGADLQWEDLDLSEREHVTKGLDEALAETLAARIYALALGRDKQMSEEAE